MSGECTLCGHVLDDHVLDRGVPSCVGVVKGWTGAGDPFPDECGCPGPTWHQQLAVTR